MTSIFVIWRWVGSDKDGYRPEIDKIIATLKEALNYVNSLKVSPDYEYIAKDKMYIYKGNSDIHQVSIQEFEIYQMSVK